MTRIQIVLASLALVAATAATPSAANDRVAIEYRQKVMSGVGADMGAIGDILKHGLPLTANIAIHANRLENSAELIPSAFEKPVWEGKTDAKPEIWRKPDEFKAALADFAKAADDLEDAADDGDAEAIQAAYKALGNSCGGCHKPFRKPKEESYKNQ